MTTNDKLQRAIDAFEPESFAVMVGASKESASPYSHEWLFTCPHCGSSRLRFNTQKRSGICWRCKTGFGVFKLVRDVLRLDEVGAVEWFLARYVGGDSTAAQLTSALIPNEPPRPAVRRLPPIAWPEGAEILTTPIAPHARAWSYLHGRGVDANMVREFGICYGRAGRTKERIVFLCRMDGALVYWQARAMWDPPAHLSDAERRQWIDETKYIKSINPKVENADDVQGHEVLFNYDAARHAQHVVINEGPFDVVKVGTHAVGLLGKVASPVKLERLKRMHAQRYTVYLDRGREEAASAAAIASELSAIAQVHIATPPEGYDPGKLTREQNAAIVAAAPRWVPGTL